MEPLATRNTNVATVRPISSKIPTPGKSRLPQSSFALPAVKRKISVDDIPKTEEKKSKLDDSVSSTSSDGSVSSTRSATSSTSGRNRSNLSKAKSASHTGINTVGNGTRPKLKASTTVTNARKPASTYANTSSRAASSTRPPTGRPNAGMSNVKKTVPSSTAAKSTSGGPKKRAAWDLKGRIQDMEELMNQQMRHKGELQSNITENMSRIANLEAINQQLEDNLSCKEKQTYEASRQVQDLEEKLRESDQKLRESSRQLQTELDDIKFAKSGLERQKASLEGELQASRTEVSGLQSTVAALTSAQSGMKAQLEATELNLEQALRQGKLKDEEISQLKQLVEEQLGCMEAMSEKLRTFETERRKLHNTIQELKGNIRVFCRVRPLLGEEMSGNDGAIHHISFPPEDPHLLELEKIGDANPNDTMCNLKKGQNKYEFTFDRVFDPESSQAQVFEEISQLVQSALDGYNVCIFAYGQTGSGKTFTMEGPPNPHEETQGMIPRSVAQIFATTNELKEKGWEYEFEASFLEIYNESIRDLLGNVQDTKHEIKMVQANSAETYVTNLTTVKVTNEEKVHSLLKKASESRAVAETKCNERSSRSHSVFRMKLSGNNKHTEESCVGLLNLVDLAGSERLKESGSQGARLKETQNINKSLANLGNVIMALANKDHHVPYRNSKLTHLLQNSLGGNSKTLMFVNVSPQEECFSETLNSLRFATKVNNCNIGTASKRKCS